MPHKRGIGVIGPGKLSEVTQRGSRERLGHMRSSVSDSRSTASRAFQAIGEAKPKKIYQQYLDVGDDQTGGNQSKNVGKECIPEGSPRFGFDYFWVPNRNLEHAKVSAEQHT